MVAKLNHQLTAASHSKPSESGESRGRKEKRQIQTDYNMMIFEWIEL